jgi:signal transduction histidine kinase
LTSRRGERDALRERLAAEQDERRRLAELIHDGPVQLLAAVAQMIDAARQAVADDDDASAERILGRAAEVAREANVDLRELLAAIEPAALHELGFATAVQQLTDMISARRALRIDLDVEAGDALGDGAQAGFYQIVREALDQAIRRGPPANVSISLRPTHAGGAELVVSDDGAGERRSAVLDGLAERTATLNGELAVEQAPGGGTTIRVTVPPSAAGR